MKGGVPYGSSKFGKGSGPILLGYLFCSGKEESLFDCNRNIFSVTSGYCTNHYYDYGLKCERMLL